MEIKFSLPQTSTAHYQAFKKWNNYLEVEHVIIFFLPWQKEKLKQILWAKF